MTPQGVLTSLVVAAVCFWAGTRFPARPATPVETELQREFSKISREELEDYLALKDQRAKYEKANQVLARVMQLFLADLGLRAGSQVCSITSVESAPMSASAAPLPLERPPLRNQNLNTQALSVSSHPESRTDYRRTKDSRKRGEAAGARRIVVEPAKAKGAVHALYQAVLWRAPDDGGGTEATNRFSEQGWETYLGNARAMIRSPEFLQDIEPNHTPQQIINRMYAVYFGRCAFANEMSRTLDTLRSENPGVVITSVISIARRRHAEQIFSGGFDPSSCGDR